MAREYKDSGIEWIGRIPKEWKTERLKGLFVERNERDCNGKTLLSVSQYFGIRPKSETDLADSHIAASYEDYKEVHKGDFVMNIMLAWNGSYAVSDYDGIVSPAYCVFKFRRDCCKRYFHYLLRTDGYPSAFKTMSRGVIDSRLRLYPEQFYTFPIIVPLLAEQQRIADYLDVKCGELDSLILLQEQMIAQLTDYKQSVITEAVTKGLDPNVELIPSGIDWIGDISRGWKVAKAKYFVNINNGSDPLTEGNIPVYGSGASSFKTCGEYKEGPAVLIGRKGATLHIPHYIVGKYWNVDTAFDVKIKHNMELRYYYYLAICFDYKYYISQTTLPGMAQSSYYNMQLPIPPIDEQVAIYTYLDNKCAEIDALIALKQKKIETLKDYKKSLIYEAVTGKIEVV